MVKKLIPGLVVALVLALFAGCAEKEEEAVALPESSLNPSVGAPVSSGTPADGGGSTSSAAPTDAPAPTAGKGAPGGTDGRGGR